MCRGTNPAQMESFFNPRFCLSAREKLFLSRNVAKRARDESSQHHSKSLAVGDTRSSFIDLPLEGICYAACHRTRWVNPCHSRQNPQDVCCAFPMGLVCCPFRLGMKCSYPGRHEKKSLPNRSTQVISLSWQQVHRRTDQDATCRVCLG